MQQPEPHHGGAPIRSRVLAPQRATWAANGRRVSGGTTIALEAAGTALLSMGGWLGGTPSYHRQIGVDPEEPRALPATSIQPRSN